MCGKEGCDDPGHHAEGFNYGSESFFTEVPTHDITAMRIKLARLREFGWIDQFTRAVAVKWTVLNSWDDKFYSVILMCEHPGLQTHDC